MNQHIIKTYPDAAKVIAKNNDTVALLMTLVGNFSRLPRAFRALIIGSTGANQSDSALVNMLTCIHQKRFYGECIPCMSGQFSTGLSEVEGVEVPALYTTPADAFESLAEEVARYQREIEDGDRDDDDEYEGMVVVVDWDGGDLFTVSDFSYPPIEMVAQEPWRWHCGNPRNIDSAFLDLKGKMSIDDIAPLSSDVARYINPEIKRK